MTTHFVRAALGSAAAVAQLQSTTTTVLSGLVQLSTLTVAAGDTVELDPAVTTTVELSGNLVVEGTLRARPNPGVTHTIRFVGVSEAAYAGGGMDVLASDVGLWVMGAGVLDLQGTPCAGWNRTGVDPTWLLGDEILRAPNAAGDYTTYAAHIPGAAVPSVTGPDGVAYPTEVFNLTRNVLVEGTPTGRAHVAIRSTEPQTIRHVAFRWLGPRQTRPGTSFTDVVLGRYPLHFHHCDNGSRGSLVEGCVVRDSSRAFVPHGSHGITFRDCVAYRITDDAYWWDPGHATNDVLFDRCAAFDVRADPPTATRVSAFRLAAGENTAALGCVAVGVHGSKDASGFQWPEQASQGADGTILPTVWRFEDCVAHNNKGDGIFVWQNVSREHRITRFVGYRNGQMGIQNGAYNNSYVFERIVVFGNVKYDIQHQALTVVVDQPRAEPNQVWRDVWCPSLLISDHNIDSARPVRFYDLKCDRVTVNEAPNPGAGVYELHADLEPADVTVVLRRSQITVIRPDGTSWQVV